MRVDIPPHWPVRVRRQVEHIVLALTDEAAQADEYLGGVGLVHHAVSRGLDRVPVKVLPGGIALDQSCQDAPLQVSEYTVPLRRVAWERVVFVPRAYLADVTEWLEGVGFAAVTPRWFDHNLRRNPPLAVLHAWFAGRCRDRDWPTAYPTGWGDRVAERVALRRREQRWRRAVRRRVSNMGTPTLRRLYREANGIPDDPTEPVMVQMTTTCIAGVDLRQTPPVAYMQPPRREPERAALPVLLHHLHTVALADSMAGPTPDG